MRGVKNGGKEEKGVKMQWKIVKTAPGSIHGGRKKTRNNNHYNLPPCAGIKSSNDVNEPTIEENHFTDHVSSIINAILIHNEISTKHTSTNKNEAQFQCKQSYNEQKRDHVNYIHAL